MEWTAAMWSFSFVLDVKPLPHWKRRERDETATFVAMKTKTKKGTQFSGHLLASVAVPLVSDLHVDGPGVLELECFPAPLLGAGEGPLARVDALVVVDVVLEAEGATAEATLEVARP